MFANLDFWSWVALSCLAVVSLFLGYRSSGGAPPPHGDVKIDTTKVLDAARALIWVEKNNKIIWSNTAHKDECIRTGKTLCSQTLNLDLERSENTHNIRRTLPNIQSGGDRHYEIFCAKNEDTLVYTSICAKTAFNAEADRDRFIQTISDSFAHLRVGISVFDKERDLTLFNPALVETLGVSPIWLAKKPSLKDVLNRLHDKGSMPEPRDFKSWRDQIVAMERNAESDDYQDDWHTPDNRILRVTGRSHPKGSVIFMFEDITKQTQTDQAYRSELERHFQILDTIETGVLVFDSAGKLSLANKEFDVLLRTELSGQILTPNVTEISEIWQDRFEPTPLWGDIRDFVSHLSERETFTGTVQKKKNIVFNVKTSALPEGYSMVEFLPIQG